MPGEFYVERKIQVNCFFEKISTSNNMLLFQSGNGNYNTNKERVLSNEKLS